MMTKIKYGPYQSQTCVRLRVYQTFAGPVGMSFIERVFAEVSTDTTDILGRLAKLDIVAKGENALIEAIPYRMMAFCHTEIQCDYHQWLREKIWEKLEIKIQ